MDPILIFVSCAFHAITISTMDKALSATFFCSLNTAFLFFFKTGTSSKHQLPWTHFFLSKCESVACRCCLMRRETVFNLQLNSAKFVELHPCLNQGFLFSLFLLLLCLVFRMTFPVSVLFWLLVSVIFFISRSQWTQPCRYVSVNFCTKIYITFVLQIGCFSPGFGFSFILINCNDLCENGVSECELSLLHAVLRQLPHCWWRFLKQAISCC